MDPTEQKYADRVSRMSPAEKIERAEALRRWSRELIVRSIRSQRPEISEAELRWELALRLYGSDPRFRAWAEERRDRVSR